MKILATDSEDVFMTTITMVTSKTYVTSIMTPSQRKLLISVVMESENAVVMATVTM